MEMLRIFEDAMQCNDDYYMRCVKEKTYVGTQWIESHLLASIEENLITMD